MSGNIGDKARFNRRRKHKLLKRRKKAEAMAARAASTLPTREAEAAPPSS